MSGEVGAGARLGSLYVLDQRIGGGAMGTVWAGHNTESGEAVAVKILHDNLGQNADLVGRFLRERSALLSVRHPNLVELRDLVVENERIALVMELVEGIDCGRLLEVHGPMPLAEAARLGDEMAQALIAVHAAGIVHRDVKPANILVESATGRAKLVDFGIAWIAGNPRLTASNSVIGTPHYLAPELLAGGAVSPAADVYELGICMYQLLTGQLPFDGEHYAQILYKHLNEAPAPHPAIPPTLWGLIEAMLAKDPGVRPTMQFVSRQLSMFARTATPLRLPPEPEPGLATAPLPEQTQPIEPPSYESSPLYSAEIPAPFDGFDAPPAAGPWPETMPTAEYSQPIEYAQPPPFSYVPAAEKGRSRKRLAVLAGICVLVIGGAAVGAWALTKGGGGGNPKPVAGGPTVSASPSHTAPSAAPPVVPALVSHHWTLCCGRLQEVSGNTTATNNGVLLNDTKNGDGVFDGRAGTQIVVDGPVINTSQSFTIAFWMHLQGSTTTPSKREVVVEQRGTEGCAACVDLDPNTKKLVFEMQSSDAAGASTTKVEATSKATSAQWYRVVAQYDARAHSMSFYLGDVKQGSAQFSANWVPTGPLSFGSGLQKGVTTDWYAGNLADLWIWNRALTPSQVDLATK